MCKRVFIVSCYLLSGPLETLKFSLAFRSLQRPFLRIRVAARSTFLSLSATEQFTNLCP